MKTRIKQLCKRKVRDFALALRARKVSGAFEKRVPGACFSKAPVNTGPANLRGRLTGNFTGPGISFLEALVNFPGTYRAQ